MLKTIKCYSEQIILGGNSIVERNTSEKHLLDAIPQQKVSNNRWFI